MTHFSAQCLEMETEARRTLRVEIQSGSLSEVSRWAWWHMLLIPALKRQGQIDLYEFEVSMVYIIRPCLKNNNNNKNKQKTQNWCLGCQRRHVAILGYHHWPAVSTPEPIFL